MNKEIVGFIHEWTENDDGTVTIRVSERYIERLGIELCTMEHWASEESEIYKIPRWKQSHTKRAWRRECVLYEQFLGLMKMALGGDQVDLLMKKIRERFPHDKGLFPQGSETKP